MSPHRTDRVMSRWGFRLRLRLRLRSGGASRQRLWNCSLCNAREHSGVMPTDVGRQACPN